MRNPFRLTTTAPILICFLIAGVPGANTSRVGTAVKEVGWAEQMHAGMIVYGIGLAAGQVRTITPAMFGGHKIWRITDYLQDPTTTKVNDYDLYDVEQRTLTPVRSVMNTEELHLELIFSEKEVILHKITQQEDVTERIPVSTPVKPEGPGLDVFVASLPLAVGYQTRYAIVDRWSGHGVTRVKRVTLSVLRKATENTSLGKRDIYDVLIKPEDNSFQIKEKVLMTTPHFPVRVEYTREGKTYPASEVVTLSNDVP